MPSPNLFRTQITGADNESDSDRIWVKQSGTANYLFYWLVENVGPDYDGKWYQGSQVVDPMLYILPSDGVLVQVRDNHGAQNLYFTGHCIEDDCI